LLLILTEDEVLMG